MARETFKGQTYSNPSGGALMTSALSKLERLDLRSNEMTN